MHYSKDRQYVLVHADGGACHGTPIEGYRCPKCGIAPDMQSTEFWKPELTNPPTVIPRDIMLHHRYPVEQDEHEVYWLKGKYHHVWFQARPSYCDRGHWIAHVEPAPGTDQLTYSIDESDKWPRYYMDYGRMLDEIRDWLDWREGDGPKQAGEAHFGR